MDYRIEAGNLHLTVPITVYNEAVLFKCFYWYGKDFSVTIEKGDPSGFVVVLTPKAVTYSVEDWREVVVKIKQDLIDFKLRDIVFRETKTIRELLVAKAFAYYEPDAHPSGTASDSVGFDPTKSRLYE